MESVFRAFREATTSGFPIYSYIPLYKPCTLGSGVTKSLGIRILLAHIFSQDFGAAKGFDTVATPTATGHPDGNLRRLGFRVVSTP